MANIVLPFLSPLQKGQAFINLKDGQLSPDALRWVIELERTIFGIWRDVAYDAANYTTIDPGTTWTVAAGDQGQLAYFQMGAYAVVVFQMSGGTVSLDVARLEITIPTLQVSATPFAFPNACVVNDGGVAALGQAVLLGTATSQAKIGIFKADNTNFLAASASISVQGHVIFMCQSFVVP